MRNALFALFFSLIISFTSCRESGSVREQSIRLGEADITVQFNDYPYDISDVYVVTSPIFSSVDNRFDALTKLNEKVFSGKIPLELSEALCGVLIDFGNCQRGLAATLSQDKPVIITINFLDNGEVESITTSQNEDLLAYEVLASAYAEFSNDQFYNPTYAPDSLYKDWKAVREYQINVALPKTLEMLNNINIPESAQSWFMNYMLMNWANLNYIPYTSIAKKINGMDVTTPPMEAWAWLNSLDYSELMLNHHLYQGLKPFLSSILHYAGGGLAPIGEKPVAEWKAYAAEALRPAIKEPTDLFLDLLSAMSYIIQIENDEQVLSETQLRNLESAYPDDLDLIIKQYNDQLLKGDENIVDLSEENFSLLEYVDREFPGQAVVVDTWNTWCMLCTNAISQIASVHDELPENVVYLYVSDVSSDYLEWKRKSREINGRSVRISDESSGKLGEEFKLAGFPSYILIDKNHKVTYAETGFMGIDNYKRMVYELSI